MRQSVYPLIYHQKIEYSKNQSYCMCPSNLTVYFSGEKFEFKSHNFTFLVIVP